MTAEITIKELLEKYTHDQALLRHVLMAKSEEDKRQTAKAILKTEQARIHLRRLELEIIKERQSVKSNACKFRVRSPESPYPHSAHPLSRSRLPSPIEKLASTENHRQMLVKIKQKIQSDNRPRAWSKLNSIRLPPIDTSIPKPFLFVD
ncbi:hypothetical protein BY458DRAFT_558696 [Sporodiniella umbellata]|nr:hypothetical protein BY458DRAFT_558696 [Sporodiniella umbellata]